MKPPAIPLPSSRRAATVALVAACLLSGLPGVSRAAGARTNEAGVRLLEAELVPGLVPLRSVKCTPLVIAVSKTTLAHPKDARAILDAALTRRVRKYRDKAPTLPCTCARRIFLASVAAAPKQSSELLDLAMELYPDCTPEFAGALSDFNAGVGIGPDGETTPGSSTMNDPMGASMLNNPDGLIDGGFGVGFGPGFPGSPGFTGSGPSAGVALPPPAVTSVLNG